MFAMRRHKHLLSYGSLFLFTVLLGAGCAFYTQTNPPRSATEQLLLSTSADRALTNIDLTIFDKQKVYVDTNYFESYDAGYALGTIRDALSRAGALLEPDAKSADIIIEPRSGAYSIDSASSLFGIPNISLPIPFSGPLPIPELALYKTQKQHSIAKFALLAYSNRSRAHIYSSGPLDGTAFNYYHKILFIYWTTTDIPENKKKEKAEKFESWHELYEPENMVFTDAPPPYMPPETLPITNSPAATNAPAATPASQ